MIEIKLRFALSACGLRRLGSQGFAGSKDIHRVFSESVHLLLGTFTFALCRAPAHYRTLFSHFAKCPKLQTGLSSGKNGRHQPKICGFLARAFGFREHEFLKLCLYALREAKFCGSANPMSGIYLSYRRMESAAYAGRLVDHLSRHFGQNSVFRDIDSIAGGQDFPHAIESALNACDAVLVVIGNNWATDTAQNGRRRLDDPKDWVRLEVAAALRRNVLVVPVLVDGARLPDPASLPEELGSLCRRHACELSDLRWSYDVGELVKDLEKVVRPPKRFKLPRIKDKELRWFAGSAIVLALLLGMALFGPTVLRRNPQGKINSVTPTLAVSQVQAGHLVYKLQKVDLSRSSVGPDGKPSQWALRCSIRIKEAMGYGIGYVNSEEIIHLLVGDEELVPKNGQSRLLYANETWDIDALFIIPANVNRVELIVGWSKDATAKIPIEISLLPKPVPPAPAGSESAPQVQAGHLVYKLQKVDLSQYLGGPGWQAITVGLAVFHPYKGGDGLWHRLR